MASRINRRAVIVAVMAMLAATSPASIGGWFTKGRTQKHRKACQAHEHSGQFGYHPTSWRPWPEAMSNCYGHSDSATFPQESGRWRPAKPPESAGEWTTPSPFDDTGAPPATFIEPAQQSVRLLKPRLIEAVLLLPVED